MSGLSKALGSLVPSSGDQISRLPLSEEDRRALDDALVSGLFKDAEVAGILREHGHRVTNNAVTYYKRKLVHEGPR